MKDPQDNICHCIDNVAYLDLVNLEYNHTFEIVEEK